MTNYEILMKNDMLAEMEERLHKDCYWCVNHERCGEPEIKPSQEACKAMWRSFFKGADTTEKLAKRMSESDDCTECPATGMCGELMWEWECENTVLAWLKNENLLYTMAMESVPSAQPERMTNFEWMTQDEQMVAIWLSEIGCDTCPAYTYCKKRSETIDESCFETLCNWLKCDFERKRI